MIAWIIFSVYAVIAIIVGYNVRNEGSGILIFAVVFWPWLAFLLAYIFIMDWITYYWGK